MNKNTNGNWAARYAEYALLYTTFISGLYAAYMHIDEGFWVAMYCGTAGMLLGSFLTTYGLVLVGMPPSSYLTALERRQNRQ